MGHRGDLYGVSHGSAIRLRSPRWADYNAWVELRQSNRDYLKAWEPTWDERHLTRASYRARLARFKQMVSNDTGYPYHIFRADDDELIGAVNITHVIRQVAQSGQIGYWIGETYAGRGLARAAVKTACRFAFDEMGLHRLEAGVRPENKRSIRLLEALGFQPEGIARGYLRIDGDWRDHHIYALLNSDLLSA